MIKKYLQVVSLALVFSSQTLFAQFGQQIDSGLVESSLINEASGLASSKKNPGVLWTHNDTNGKNRIFALSGKGKHLGSYCVDRCPIRDWEDVAVGPGPVDSNSYIYLGNIGDNDFKYDVKCVYRCVEPKVSTLQDTITDTIRNNDTLQFVYPGGVKYDAEALMIDPLTKDYYVITKTNSVAIVYKAAYPQPTGWSKIDTLESIDTLAIDDVVSADISPSGSEIIIKNTKKMFYWVRNDNETIRDALSRVSQRISYTEEPQGEAVAWDNNASGYFTISEETGADCHLYYYARIVGIKHKPVQSCQSGNITAPVTLLSIDRYNFSSCYYLTGRVAPAARKSNLKNQTLQIIVSKSGKR